VLDARGFGIEGAGLTIGVIAGLVLLGTLGSLPLARVALLSDTFGLLGFVLPGTLGLLPLARPALLPDAFGLLGFVLPGTPGLLPLFRLGLLPGTVGFLLVCAERTEIAVAQIAMMPKYFSR
jgi:hypothetical protein